MTDPDRRRLTALGATALVVANMVGTGIFVTTGFLSARLGSPLLVLAVWAAGGLLALCGADVYAELGGMMPRVGGEYVYLSRAFHPAVGFLSGWVSLLAGFSAPAAASAYAFGAYLKAAAPLVPAGAAAAGAIVLLSAFHARDVAVGSRVQTLLVAFKVGLIVLFVAAAFGWGTGDLGHFSEGTSSATPGSLAVALVLVSFAYSGWNAAAYVAGELDDPGRSLPRALLLGTGLVLVLYLGLNLSFFWAAPAIDLAKDPAAVGAVAARALFGPLPGGAFSALIALALLSSLSGILMAGPRVYVAMAEDGLFFRAFARRGTRGAPAASVALQGALALAMLLTATFEDLLTYIGFTINLFSALTVAAAFVLRRRLPDAARPYRARAWPVSPALFLLLSTGMTLFAILERPAVALAGLATLASGGLFYLAFRRRIIRPTGEVGTARPPA